MEKVQADRMELPPDSSVGVGLKSCAANIRGLQGGCRKME